MKAIFRKFRHARPAPRARRVVQIALGVLCASAVSHAASAKLDQALTAYDTAITASPEAPITKLTDPLTLDGTAGAPFDFGATFGDTTIEFILNGNPAAGEDAYLAVGEIPASSLRYAQWQNTQQMGFTQAGVADYLFSPAVPSPVVPTHVTYAWNSVDLTMNLYINGALAGSVTGVSPDFVMPSGPGFLGSTAAGGEVMTGTIYRVSVFSGVLPDEQIKSHADAFATVAWPAINAFVATPPEINAQASSTLSWQVQNTDAVYLNGNLITGTNQVVSPAVTTSYTLVASNEVATVSARLRVLVNPPLDLYDTTVAGDQTNGLVPIAILTNIVNLDGTAGAPFDFGATSGSSTFEFILEGDPTVGPDAYLAVGEISSSSLRYEQYLDTESLGFTQIGVADYLFAPAVPSPTIATHVVYVWNAETFTMKIYVNGVLAGTVNNVSPDFVMPSGPGFLGSNVNGGEAMTGRILRLAIYSGELPETAIQKHATAFTSVLRPPIISSFTATPGDILGQGSSLLEWQVQDATVVLLNGADVTGQTNQTVTPASTTSYTLVASNNISSVTSKITVTVTPILTNYDAVISADTTGGLEPLALLTNIVTLTGAGGVPFDFGPTFGDTSIEFILEGDPTLAPDGYLAVGETGTSSLRYAQWQNTRLMGFTQPAVADYLFTPEVSSPTVPTHVTYVWNSTDLSMTLYTNGVLAGTVTGVSPEFAMPSGPGFLGATPAGTEAMYGRILRVVVYSGLLPEETIQKHAAAFGSTPVTPVGPSLAIAVTAAKPAITLQGIAGIHYRVEYTDSLGAGASWQLLQDIPSLSGSSIQIDDSTTITGKTQRFYRAIAVP